MSFEKMKMKGTLQWVTPIEKKVEISSIHPNIIGNNILFDRFNIKLTILKVA